MKKFLVLVLLSVLFFVGCEKNNTDSKKVKKIIEVGAILPLTGSLAQYGQSGKEGMNIAIEEFNKKYPNRVKVLLEDDKGTVKDGINAVNKLIFQNNVKIIMGAMSSSVTLGIAPIVENNKVVLISPTSTASAITNAGDYIFRVCVSDEFEGKAMASYVVNSIKYDKLGILFINNDYGIGLKENFKKVIISKNKSIDFEYGYDPKTINFKTIIEKLKQREIDLLYIVAQKEQINFFKQAKELKYHPKFIGTTMMEDKELLKEMKGFLKGTQYTYRSFDVNSSKKVSFDFVKKYKQKYNKVPDFYAASVYDATRLMLDTVNNKKNDSNIFKKFLYGLKDYEAVTGTINFDKNGDVSQGFSIKTIGE